MTYDEDPTFMADDRKNVFEEIERIERQADELLEAARAEAAETAEKSQDEIKQLAAETDRQIEQTNDRLAAEHKTHTEQALSQIDVEFLKAEEALETGREKRFDELVAWTASRITQQLMASES